MSLSCFHEPQTTHILSFILLWLILPMTNLSSGFHLSIHLRHQICQTHSKGCTRCSVTCGSKCTTTKQRDGSSSTWIPWTPSNTVFFIFTYSGTHTPTNVRHYTIFCDTFTGVLRPFIPIKFCYTVFHSLYSLSYPGIQATRHIITARYVWPGINNDVRRWAHVMSMFQGTMTYCYTTLHISKPRYSFRLDPYSRPAFSNKWLYLSTYLYRLVLSLAWNHSSHQYYSLSFCWLLEFPALVSYLQS